ncbi:GGDEF domain-containing protein [Pseudobacteriovorax antillogorgiicola]|uniref:diguanylate cyclase n=1 Tax=Pseudobacteriovorax antillogorgiicola TaxID=1513793 RepID=A0A1Y6B767_9BACT|nr:GGDEF domain-containing protein [Pseudobacteriovorax antillogorgiicola]TCS58636.1 diguanylate cyclase (GGDEF)-like protein [Pseudobacteriovorax antillogorgiicola]SME96548.1 diguanylate cyclase (GGDEF) domain-containing protein [Pseudobacteriovorax antillogorgiicola]
MPAKHDVSTGADRNLDTIALKVAQELGDQTTLADLVDATTHVWQRYFPGQPLSFIPASSHNGKLLVQDPPAHREFETGINELCGQIRTMPRRKLGYADIMSVRVGDRLWNIFLLQFERMDLGFFAWRHQSMERRQRLKSLILGQAHVISRWCCRFQKTQELLHRDDLTNLYNYRYLEACLDAEMKRVQRFQTSFSLLFIDLDSFKPINDKYGHLAGSEVLKQVAQVLRLELRDVDSIFRYGGDEFVVLLLEANSLKAWGVADRLREKIAQHEFSIGQDAVAHVTASIGIACCPEHGSDKAALLKLADECMYRSKRGGKNKVVMVGRKSGPSDDQAEMRNLDE